MWDDLLDSLIDHHASKPASERGGEDCDFIDVLLSVQQEYNLTKDHIKAQLTVRTYSMTSQLNGTFTYTSHTSKASPALYAC
jgi:hypothetical protein